MATAALSLANAPLTAGRQWPLRWASGEASRIRQVPAENLDSEAQLITQCLTGEDEA